MKRRLRRLLVFAGVLGFLMVLNVGAALATHEGPAFDDANAINVECNGPPGSCGDGKTNVDAAALTPGAIPVGSAIGPFNLPEEDLHPGARNMSDQVIVAITNNPNCPLHWTV